MGTLNYRISLSLGSRMDISRGISASIFPFIEQAIEGVAQATASRWIQGIQSGKMWSGEKDAYSKSVTIRRTGDFSRMVESDYRYAQDIETGRPARDLKKMLNTSMKVRTTKDGTRYLIIPFRHNADTVPAQAKSMSLSTITGHGRRLSGTGAFSLTTKAPATVRQRAYNWGDRLAGAGVSKAQQGMVRMNTATGTGKKSSAYLTFRVMSEKSQGWVTKPQPGQYIVRDVAAEMQPIAEQFLAEAVKRSI